MENKDVLTLYHGLKSGIDGAIAPMSRDRCDFGKGFYMGDEKSQPLTLICNYSNATCYTVYVKSWLIESKNIWNNATAIPPALDGGLR